MSKNRFTLLLCLEGCILRSKKTYTYRKTKNRKNNPWFSICSSWSLTFLLLPSAPMRQMSSSCSTLGYGAMNGAWGMWHVQEGVNHSVRPALAYACGRVSEWVSEWACAIWLCANVSFCLFMGCDNVDGCHCHLWLPPQQMGSGSDRRRKVSEISPLDRRQGAGGGGRVLSSKLKAAHVKHTSN